jgi:hypothetical protein
MSSDLAKQFDLAMKTLHELRRTSAATQQIGSLRSQLANAKSKAAANSALLALIMSLDAESANIAGAGGARNAEVPPSGLSAARSQLNAVLNVVDSADRTPPAQAYALFDQASRDVASQIAAWEALKSGKLIDLNRAFENQKLPRIELRQNQGNLN